MTYKGFEMKKTKQKYTFQQIYVKYIYICLCLIEENLSLLLSFPELGSALPQLFWHERAAFQRSSFRRSRSDGRLLAMT